MDEATSATMTLTVQCTDANKFSVSVPMDTTVVEFKALIVGQASCPAEQQRLIHRGRVLKDEATLESYGISDSHTVHLVRSTAPASPPPAGGAAASAAAAPGMGGASANPLASMMAQGGGMGGPPDMNRMQQQLMQNPEMMQSIMNSPMMQNLMDNPEMIRNMFMSNPQMQAVLEANPQLNHVLNDPALMRQTMEMARNPAAMQQVSGRRGGVRLRVRLGARRRRRRRRHRRRRAPGLRGRQLAGRRQRPTHLGRALPKHIHPPCRSSP
mmetsp:Transcript_71670/g.202621  ORF Transcript_71670/g.202621 Transcript_71670/m.202621 type:complete len:269 (-) Transcript_71670:1069-1875(-)